MTKLAAVIFDLDGVLVDTARFHYLAWQRLADEEGVPFDREFNERFKGVSRRECVRMLFPDRPDPEKLTSLATRKNEYYKEMVETLTPADLFEGARPLIEELRRAGVLTAIASVSKNTARVVEKLEVQALFDAVVDGNDVVNSKPAPDVFLLTAERLVVAPGECVVLEDAQAGVVAAHAAGMPAVGIGSPQRLHQAQCVVASVREISVAMLIDVVEGRDR